MTGTDFTKREIYKFWIEEIVRFADIDMLGHLNNNAIGVFCESARFEIFVQTGFLFNTEERIIVVARTTYDYLAQVTYPAELHIGTGVAKIGRSSVTLASGVFDGDKCVATHHAVCVYLDRSRKESMEIPED